MNAVNQLTQIEAIMDESLEKAVGKIVERALEVRLSRLVERVVSNITDELSGLASNVEDVISDAISSAERAGEPDCADVEELQKDLTESLLQKIREKNLLAEEAAAQESQGPTIAEQVDRGEMSTMEALHQTLGMRRLTDDEVAQHLSVLSKQYEPQFALFLWRNRNGSL